MTSASLGLESKWYNLKAKASLPVLFLFLSSAISLFIVLYFNGTGLEADSFHHHLIARYAPLHSELYFDHWGKPIYTLISSPFAQFGFLGSKIFNVLCSLGSMYTAYLILKKLRVEFAAWVIPIFFIIPLNFQISFSAFTEALFALTLLIGIYQAVNKKNAAAAIIISLLPLIRSEGLVVIPLFALFFLLKREYMSTLLLAFGQLIYSILGVLFLNKSFLWVLGEIPYASLNSPYGRGDLFHFPEQLFYVLGPVLTVLFVLSLLLSPIIIRTKGRSYTLLILGSFLAYFIFHSISWYMGWFNSMGLKRVLGGVTPLMAIIIVMGMDSLLKRVEDQRIRFISCSAIVLLSSALLFSKGPAGINWKKEMNLSPPQEIAMEVANYIRSQKYISNRILFSDRYLAEGLELDIYDTDKFRLLSKENLAQIKPNELVIWDNWHSPIDFGIELQDMEANEKLEKLKEFYKKDGNREVRYILFRSN